MIDWIHVDWIDAKLALPPKNYEVLVYVETNPEFCTDDFHYAIDARVNMFDVVVWRSEGLGYGKVLYWTDLPPAPHAFE